MRELEKILEEHAIRYPLMQPTDAVKLIYQNEFGGGHLIRNEDAVLNYLFREYASVKKDPSIGLYEDIGNGIVRVNLAAIEESKVEKLGRAFLTSAAEHKGDLENFQKKLEALRRLTGRGVFRFNTEDLQVYLREYANAGYPMVSHSQQYREAYSPAYRIILKSHLL